LQKKLHNLLDQQLVGTMAQRVALAVRLLSSAIFAVRRATALQIDSARPLVSAENITLHVRYPYNHFVGLLMELSQARSFDPRWSFVLCGFRDGALRSLRATARTNPRSVPGEAFIQDHSQHMLCRHGDAADRHAIKATIERGRHSADPMTRRLAYAGLSLADLDPQIAERYLTRVVEDEQLRLAKIAFDALHFGDIQLRDVDSDYVQLTAPPLKAIQHIVRHIIFVNEYHGILRIEEQTLTDIVDFFGPAAIIDADVTGSLQASLAAGDAAESSTAAYVAISRLRDECAHRAKFGAFVT
jgi:hypothetical protein